MTRPAPLRPLHVLVVEDDDDHAELTAHAIEQHDPRHTTDRVADGAAALDYLRARSRSGARDLPDLVLLDLNLPRVSGLDVLAEVKGDPSLRSVPVVVLTTSDAAEDRARAYQRHANSYLVKPINFPVFEAMVREIGEYWARWNRSPHPSA